MCCACSSDTVTPDEEDDSTTDDSDCTSDISITDAYGDTCDWYLQTLPYVDIMMMMTLPLILLAALVAVDATVMTAEAIGNQRRIPMTQNLAPMISQPKIYGGMTAPGMMRTQLDVDTMMMKISSLTYYAALVVADAMLVNNAQPGMEETMETMMVPMIQVFASMMTLLQIVTETLAQVIMMLTQLNAACRMITISILWINAALAKVQPLHALMTLQ
jgi:hypothetical protein